MPSSITRRGALGAIAAIMAGACSGAKHRPAVMAATHLAKDHLEKNDPNQLRVSLAQWSLHRMIRRGELEPMGFPAYAKHTFDIAGVEYVNQFYQSLPRTTQWAMELRKRASDAGVASVLIMCDGEGDLGSLEDAKRLQAIENHKFWLDVGAVLGCHAIRVNAHSDAPAAQQLELCAKGIAQLCEVARPMNLKVLVENHGGLSCDGAWVAALVRATGATNCGTLPDFGNFTCEDGTTRDRYAGMREMLPFAGGVSAKSNDFDAQGEETATDYARMLAAVRGAGYRGWIGAEYEGDRLGEVEGTRATRDLLLKNGCTL